jgi:branched-chain amino acid transport system substrate-binding protein
MILCAVLFSACVNSTQNQTKEPDVVKISAILSLTGNGATLGNYAKKGLELAVEEKNAAGGILGKQIVLDISDSKSEAKEGITLAQSTLASENKPLLLYVQLSAVSLAVKPVAEQNKQMMFALSGADNLLQGTNYTFRNWLPPLEAGKALTKFMKESLNINEYGIIYANSEFARSMKDAAITEGNQNGLKLLFEEPYDEQSMDFKTVALKAVKNNPKYIYVVGIGKSLGTMVKQLRENGYEGVILGDATLNLPDVKETAGAALNGAYFVDFGFDNQSTSPKTIAFTNKFKEKFNDAPQTLSAISYDAMQLLFDAVEKEKSFDQAKLIQHLNNKSNFEGVFGAVNIKNFDIIYPMSLKKMEVK